MVFVKPAVRKSLLAKMLGEILDTRVMIKHAMKGARGDKVGSASLWQLLIAGFDSAHECSTAWSEAHGGMSASPIFADVECHLWVHFCDLLWSDAVHRGGG